LARLAALIPAASPPIIRKIIIASAYAVIFKNGSRYDNIICFGFDIEPSKSVHRRGLFITYKCKVLSVKFKADVFYLFYKIKYDYSRLDSEINNTTIGNIIQAAQ
jgi:hypothetical protein